MGLYDGTEEKTVVGTSGWLNERVPDGTMAIIQQTVRGHTRKCSHRSRLNRRYENLDPHGSQSNLQGKARPESKAAPLGHTLPGEPPSRSEERSRTLP
jgi:hypothetical protein